MKKLFWFSCILALIFIIGYSPINNKIVVAEEIKLENSGLENAIEDALENLELDALENYLQDLQGNSSEDIKARLIRYIKGDSVHYESIFAQISEIFFIKIADLLPSFSCIIAIALLCGILSSLQVGTMDKTVTKTVYSIAFIATLIPVFNVVSECYSSANESVEKMKTQMQIIFPILLTLLAASGGVASVAICKPSVAFLSTSMVQIISDVVFPIVVIMIAFSMLNRVSEDFRFGKFTALLKSVNKWLIGMGLSVFGLFFTVQGLAAGSYDGIVRRAAKYAIGNGIPIVGGFLSGGFDLAIAGSVLIKNSLGYLGVILMLSTIFQPLLTLISTTLLLRLTAALTSPFGESRISDFLSETADCMNYLSAGVLFTAFLYFLSIVITVSVSGVFL